MIQVIAIQRYTSEPHSIKLLKFTESYSDLYDVTLSDGSEKIKCCLHPTLNAFVDGAQVMWAVGDIICLIVRLLYVV